MLSSAHSTTMRTGRGHIDLAEHRSSYQDQIPKNTETGKKSGWSHPHITLYPDTYFIPKPSELLKMRGSLRPPRWMYSTVKSGVGRKKEGRC